MLFHEHTILGWVQTGGFVTPSLQHSFLLMFMRMALVVPLMAGLAPTLHSGVWKEVGELRQPNRRLLLAQAIGCGGLMFLYLALLYVAIGLIPTGIAMTLFFTYPAFTALLSWRVFGDRPTRLRWGVMGLVFLGSVLTLPQEGTATQSAALIGCGLALLSGVAYAVYTIIAQTSLRTLHPVPFTWLSFATTLVLSGLSLLLGAMPDASLPWLPLWIGALLSALVTFSGHLLNNFGIRYIGATAAAMIGASNPALTVVLAWLTIQETLSAIQVTGVVIVTLSVALLSRELRK